ncbi:MAG: gamma-glutamyltransferase [Gammaproteobacteria bacterium]|nr:gamma-glutamyltransferase [Gammaproteobacteria bacterium]
MLKRIIPLLLTSIAQIVNAASPAPVQGSKFMAVSSQRYATEVGACILKQGGNAVDAAVAMGYALAVVNPCCGNIGGGGFMLIRFANGHATFLNFREKAPKKSRLDLFLDPKGNVIFENLSTGHIKGALAKPYLAVGIPGTVMGLNKALEKYGTLPLSQVLAPAIRLAEDGYLLLPGDVSILKTGEESFKTQPNVCAIFMKGGRSYNPGDRLVQKNLATTLKEIASKGTAGFYQGKIAEEIVKASNKNGGVITKSDLSHYSIDEQSPLVCTYRGYKIITTPPPGSGTTICEALKILEPYKLREYGFHSAMGTHYAVEAMRFSYADRNRYLGDPNFIQNPVKTLLSQSHIRKIQAQIKPNKATPSDRIRWDIPEGSNTTSYVVIDRKGNAVSVTYTLNDYFGSKVIPGKTGFFLNNEMADFTIKPNTSNTYGLYQGKQNLLEPNKRPLSSMAPTIMTKDDKLFLVIGTPGGSTIPSQIINVILNVIDYGMNIQEAEDAPRFHMQWLPDKIFMEQFAFSRDTQAILEKMGYQLKLGSPYDTPYWGAVSGILIDSETHKFYGAMDSRRPTGAAIGE